MFKSRALTGTCPAASRYQWDFSCSWEAAHINLGDYLCPCIPPCSAWQQEFDGKVNSQVCIDKSYENLSFSQTIMHCVWKCSDLATSTLAQNQLQIFEKELRADPAVQKGRDFHSGEMPHLWQWNDWKKCISSAEKSKNILQTIYKLLMVMWPSDICRSLSNYELPNSVFPHRLLHIYKIWDSFCTCSPSFLHFLTALFPFQLINGLGKIIIYVTSDTLHMLKCLTFYYI